MNAPRPPWSTAPVSFVQVDTSVDYSFSGIARSGGLLFCAPARADFVLVVDPEAESIRKIRGAGSGNSK